MSLTSDEKLIAALVLGDGHLARPYGKSARLSFCHSLEQIEWFEVKVGWMDQIGLRDGKVSDRTWTVEGKEHHGKEYSAPCHGFEHLREMIYPDGVKAFTSKVVEELGPRELAVLWCDDGCLHQRIRVRSSRPNPTIEWQGCFAIYKPLLDAEIFSDRIKALSGAKCWQVYHQPSKSYQVRLGGPALRKLIPLIEPFMLASMKWKIDLTPVPVCERAQVLQQRAIRRQERAAA